MQIHSVTIKFPGQGNEYHTKKEIFINNSIQYGPRPLIQNRVLHSRILSPYFPILYHSYTLVLDKHSSPYAFFNIFNIPVGFFFEFKQNKMADLCSVLNLSTVTKSYHPKSSSLRMQQPNKFKLSIRMNKRSF
jgi:hypothetical protein